MSVALTHFHHRGGTTAADVIWYSMPKDGETPPVGYTPVRYAVRWVFTGREDTVVIYMEKPDELQCLIDWWTKTSVGECVYSRID